MNQSVKLWRSPEFLLYLMAAAVPLSFATWQTLLNNFAIEAAQFTGAEIGILQSLREVPGFLAFTVVFLLLVMREQVLAWVALLLLGIGTAVTGYFPSVVGLYATTVLMSLGFHYSEAVQESLTLQWIDKRRTAEVMGRVVAVRAFAGLAVFAGVYLCLDVFSLEYSWIYLLGGGVTVAVALVAAWAYPQFATVVEQHRHIVLRSRYWLYYALVFFSGARRQIFIVFAGFLMVEKFQYSASAIAMLFLINGALTVYLAPKIGRLIARFGERRSLTFEYLGLIGVFTTYAFVENHVLAASLYVVDHIFFAMAIAIKTYFQKIADPADIAASAGVSFTINHIAAVVLPILLGYLWLSSPAAVFLCGSGFALVSLLLVQLIPRQPAVGCEVTFAGRVVGPRGAPVR